MNLSHWQGEGRALHKDMGYDLGRDRDRGCSQVDNESRRQNVLNLRVGITRHPIRVEMVLEYSYLFISMFLNKLFSAGWKSASYLDIL